MCLYIYIYFIRFSSQNSKEDKVFCIFRKGIVGNCRWKFFESLFAVGRLNIRCFHKYILYLESDRLARVPNSEYKESLLLELVPNYF